MCRESKHLPKPKEIWYSEIDIDEYIAAQPEDIRETLSAVQNTIATAIPAAEERISFQMPIWWRVHTPPGAR